MGSVGSGTPVECVGVDNVIELWHMHDTPYYSLWHGKSLKFINSEADMTLAEERLRSTLEPIQAMGNITIYTLKVHKSEPDSRKPDDYVGSFNFRLNDPSVGFVNRGNDRNNDVFVVNQPAPARTNNSSLEAKLDKLIDLFSTKQIGNTKSEEEEEEDDEDEIEQEIINEPTEEEKMLKITNNIKVIVENAAPIVGVIFGEIKKLMSGNTTQQPTPQMPGTIGNIDSNLSNQDKLNQAVQILVTVLGEQEFCDAMGKLAAKAQKDPDSVKMLLKFL